MNKLGDAALAYAQIKADYLRSFYNHKIASANLLYATGMDLKEIK